MNRTANAIKMLKYLSTGNKYSKKELSDLIHTKDRNIYELKLELEEAGFMFKELKGRYGGYALESKELLCLPKLSSDDIDRLYDLYHRIDQNPDFLDSNNISETLRKILMLLPVPVEKPHMRVTTEVSEDISEVYTTIKHAVSNRHPIKGVYASFSSIKERHLYPYDLVSVNRKWYCIAHDVDDVDEPDCKVYLLSRFESIEAQPETYWVDPAYRLKKYVDEHGLVKIGDNKRLLLKISGPYIKPLMEKQIGHNVTIDNFGNFIHYRTELRGDTIIKEFIMKMGSHCQVIEPQDIKGMIRDEYMKCLETNK